MVVQHSSKSDSWGAACPPDVVLALVERVRRAEARIAELEHRGRCRIALNARVRVTDARSAYHGHTGVVVYAVGSHGYGVLLENKCGLVHPSTPQDLVVIEGPAASSLSATYSCRIRTTRRGALRSKLCASTARTTWSCSGTSPTSIPCRHTAAIQPGPPC